MLFQNMKDAEEILSNFKFEHLVQLLAQATLKNMMNKLNIS